MDSITTSLLNSIVAPKWVDDTTSTECSICNSQFGLLMHRRHHCRTCGQLMCSACTEKVYQKKEYIIAPGNTYTGYLNPSSLQYILKRPETGSTLSGWLPFQASETVKLCSNCALPIIQENDNWDDMYVLIRCLYLLSREERGKIIRMVYHMYLESPYSIQSGFALMGRCVYIVMTLDNTIAMISEYLQWPILAELFYFVYELIMGDDETTPLYTRMEAQKVHQCIALYMNIPRSALCPTFKRVSKMPLMSNQTPEYYVIHLLLSKFFEYNRTLNIGLFKQCWKVLFNNHTTLELFTQYRFYTEIFFSNMVSTQHITGAEPNTLLTPNSYREFLDFLSGNFNKHTYSQAIQTILHSTLFTQPVLAEACAHVLHLNVEPIQTFYKSIYDKIRNILISEKPPPIQTNPFNGRRYVLDFLNTMEKCGDFNTTYLNGNTGLGSVVKIDGRYTVFPIENATFQSIIMPLIHIFSKLQSIPRTDFQTIRIQHIPNIQLLVQDNSLQSAVGYVYQTTNIQPLHDQGSIHELDVCIPNVSPLCYALIYFIQSFTEFCHDLDLDLVIHPELPVVWIDPTENNIKCPLTWGAINSIRTHIYKTKPLTDKILQSIQQLCTLLLTQYGMQIWLAFYPIAFSLRSKKMPEHIMYQFMSKLFAVHHSDTFRVQFLELMK